MVGKDKIFKSFALHHGFKSRAVSRSINGTPKVIALKNVRVIHYQMTLSRAFNPSKRSTTAAQEKNKSDPMFTANGWIFTTHAYILLINEHSIEHDAIHCSSSQDSQQPIRIRDSLLRLELSGTCTPGKLLSSSAPEPSYPIHDLEAADHEAFSFPSSRNT